MGFVCLSNITGTSRLKETRMEEWRRKRRITSSSKQNRFSFEGEEIFFGEAEVWRMVKKKSTLIF